MPSYDLQTEPLTPWSGCQGLLWPGRILLSQPHLGFYFQLPVPAHTGPISPSCLWAWGKLPAQLNGPCLHFLFLTAISHPPRPKEAWLDFPQSKVISFLFLLIYFFKVIGLNAPKCTPVPALTTVWLAFLVKCVCVYLPHRSNGRGPVLQSWSYASSFRSHSAPTHIPWRCCRFGFPGHTKAMFTLDCSLLSMQQHHV